MKIIVLITCMLFCGTASEATKHQNLSHFNNKIEIAQGIEDLINDFIQKLEDPIEATEQTYNILLWTIHLKDIHIDGLPTIVVELSVDVLFSIKVRVGVSLKTLNARVSLWESTFPIIYGKGKAGIAITDASVMLEVEFNYDGTAKPSNVKISVGSANFIVTGLHNDEGLSRSITCMVNHTLNVLVEDPDFQAKLASFIDELILLVLSPK